MVNLQVFIGNLHDKLKTNLSNTVIERLVSKFDEGFTNTISK